MRSAALRRPAWLFPGFLLRWPCPSPRVWAVRWFSALQGEQPPFPPTSTSLRAWGRRFLLQWFLTRRAILDFTAQRQEGYAVHTYRSLLCWQCNTASVAGRATYLAVHLELGCGHHRTAGRPWRVGPRGCWRAALVAVTAGWHHRVPASIMAPMWPLAGTAACRGLAEVARDDGLAHGDLRPGGSRLACKWRGRIGFAQEASSAASPRWRASFVPSC